MARAAAATDPSVSVNAIGDWSISPSEQYSVLYRLQLHHWCNVCDLSRKQRGLCDVWRHGLPCSQCAALHCIVHNCTCVFGWVWMVRGRPRLYE